MFEGDPADMHTRNFLIVLIGGPTEGLPFPDPGTRTPISD